MTQDLMTSWGGDPSVEALLGPQGRPTSATRPRWCASRRSATTSSYPSSRACSPRTSLRGLGHYPGTALPGQLGNFARGHRVTHGEPFRQLPSLRPGDEVVVETADAVYTYGMTSGPNELIVQPQDTWVLDPIPRKPSGAPPDRARITLTTCAELFHSSDRMIAFGQLVDTERKRA